MTGKWNGIRTDKEDGGRVRKKMWVQVLGELRRRLMKEEGCGRRSRKEE